MASATVATSAHPSAFDHAAKKDEPRPGLNMREVEYVTVGRCPVLLRAMAPFQQTLSFYLPTSLRAVDILSDISERLCLNSSSSSLLRLYTRGGQPIKGHTDLASLSRDVAFVELEIRLSTLGGKGGFGSMLRAQGGKMSVKRGEENTDACRDLNGRRLKTVKEAKELATYLAEAPAREAAMSKAQADKYAKLERMLGRKPKSAQDFEVAASKLDEAGGSLGEGEDRGEGPSNVVPVRGREAETSGVSSGAGKRDRFDDHKFIEQSREAVDKAKSAVAIAMAKRKKAAAAAKAKTSTEIATATAGSSDHSPSPLVLRH